MVLKRQVWSKRQLLNERVAGVLYLMSGIIVAKRMPYTGLHSTIRSCGDNAGLHGQKNPTAENVMGTRGGNADEFH
jgi:hypothetical protein